MALPSPRLEALHRLVQEAGELALDCRKRLATELKPDGSIVTNADKSVELFLRPKLVELVPESTVWGEEFGYEAPGPGGLWAVDPIDGTSNFNYGGPLWGVSAGLIQDGKITLGGISLPEFDEVYVAELGVGAFCNGERMPLVPPGIVRPEQLVGCNELMVQKFDDVNAPGKSRLSGSIVIDGVFVATQRYRGLLNHRVWLYDIAASLLLASECGAFVGYTDGTEFDISELIKPTKIGSSWMVFPRESGFSIPI